MNGKDIIKAIMEEKGIAKCTLAKRINITNAAMWDRLKDTKNNDMTLSNLNQMLQAMDYKIIITPSSTKLPKDSYEFDNDK